jgi:hypothetical protein
MRKPLLCGIWGFGGHKPDLVSEAVECCNRGIELKPF